MTMHIPEKNRGGFTLIELAIVLFIMGLIAAPLIRFYSIYYQKKIMEETVDNIEKIKPQISYFFQKNPNHYPCPSDRSLSMNDPNFGREFDVNCDPATIGLVAPNTCTPGGGVCLVAGNKDFSDPPDGDKTDPDELVIIGGVPVVSIREKTKYQFPNSLAFDGWGNKITYAVTLALAKGGSYKFYGGQIKAIDEFLENTAGIEDNAHYVLVSHGKNGKGAFPSGSTTPPFPCGSSLGIDDENCDTDSVFMSALGVYEGNSPSYFDDYTFFMINNNSAIWALITPPPPPAPPEPVHMYNLNSGNVGVNTVTPTSKLDVEGTLRADNNVKAAQICKKSSGDCFPIEAITGDTADMRCPAGQVMIGISLSHAQCEIPTFAAPMNVDCSPFWVNGITSKGCVICTDGTRHCP